MRRIEYVLEIHIETISLVDYIFMILSDVEKKRKALEKIIY